MWTSWTSLAGTSAGSSAALIDVAPSLGPGTADSDPRKLPMAVRAAPTITTSRMTRAYRAVPNGVNPPVTLRNDRLAHAGAVDLRVRAERVELGPRRRLVL